MRGGARYGAGRPRGSGTWGEPTKPMRIPLSLVAEVENFLQTKMWLSVPIPPHTFAKYGSHVTKSIDATVVADNDVLAATNTGGGEPNKERSTS